MIRSGLLSGRPPSGGQNVEVAVVGRGTDVLEGDVERTDILDNGVLETRLDEAGVDGAGVDEKGALDIDHGVSGAPRTAGRVDSLPEPRDEKKFAVDQSKAADQPEAADRSQKVRDRQTWTSRLTMFAVAVAAFVGLAVLAIAIAREVNAANASDDLGDLGFSYTCDKVSGSDPGVYGVGHCRAAGGMQASGVIPVGQAYLLTPRKANTLGYTQSFSCSGGRADSPSMVVPKRCAAIGNPVLASK